MTASRARRAARETAPPGSPGSSTPSTARSTTSTGSPSSPCRSRPRAEAGASSGSSTTRSPARRSPPPREWAHAWTAGSCGSRLTGRPLERGARRNWLLLQSAAPGRPGTPALGRPARGARHPARRLGGARPVLGGLRAPRRLLRGRAATLGPRGGRPDRPGGGSTVTALEGCSRLPDHRRGRSRPRGAARRAAGAPLRARPLLRRTAGR